VRRTYIAACLLLLASCTARPGQVSPATTPVLQPSISLEATKTLPVTPVPTRTAPAVPTETPSPSPEAQPVQAFSPLESFSLEELPEILVVPFKAPRPGQDDGHHGTDFAFFRRGDRDSILGLGVNAIFTGKIAAAVQDRPPYGNMVMVETPLDDLPDNLIGFGSLPPLPTVIPGNIRLSCPTLETPTVDGDDPKSLYLLYAHMEKAPAWKMGDPVKSGQLLGSVGNTGDSSNPHLHLEARIGPSGSTFAGMAHYTNSASPAEIAGYCTWRVSGVYRLIDPMQLLTVHQVDGSNGF